MHHLNPRAESSESLPETLNPRQSPILGFTYKNQS